MMRSPISTPELIERVMVRDPRAAEILASKPVCHMALCRNPAKFVMLAPKDGTTLLAVCGTHKNERLNVWAWMEGRRLRRERDEQRAKEASYAANLATMLTDARHNPSALRALNGDPRVTFSHDDHGNVRLSRDEAQRLLEAWS